MGHRLARCEDKGEWAAAAVCDEVDLGGQAAAGASEGMVVRRGTGPL